MIIYINRMSYISSKDEKIKGLKLKGVKDFKNNDVNDLTTYGKVAAYITDIWLDALPKSKLQKYKILADKGITADVVKKSIDVAKKIGNPDFKDYPYSGYTYWLDNDKFKEFVDGLIKYLPVKMTSLEKDNMLFPVIDNLLKSELSEGVKINTISSLGNIDYRVINRYISSKNPAQIPLRILKKVIEILKPKEEEQQKKTEEQLEKCPAETKEVPSVEEFKKLDDKGKKKLYLRYSLLFHPDKNPTCLKLATEKFKQLKDNYDKSIGILKEEEEEEEEEVVTEEDKKYTNNILFPRWYKKNLRTFDTMKKNKSTDTRSWRFFKRDAENVYSDLRNTGLNEENTIKFEKFINAIKVEYLKSMKKGRKFEKEKKTTKKEEPQKKKEEPKKEPKKKKGKKKGKEMTAEEAEENEIFQKNKKKTILSSIGKDITNKSKKEKCMEKSQLLFNLSDQTGGFEMDRLSLKELDLLYEWLGYGFFPKDFKKEQKIERIKEIVNNYDLNGRKIINECKEEIIEKPTDAEKKKLNKFFDDTLNDFEKMMKKQLETWEKNKNDSNEEELTKIVRKMINQVKKFNRDTNKIIKKLMGKKWKYYEEERKRYFDKKSKLINNGINKIVDELNKIKMGKLKKEPKPEPKKEENEWNTLWGIALEEAIPIIKKLYKNGKIDQNAINELSKTDIDKLKKINSMYLSTNHDPFINKFKGGIDATNMRDIKNILFDLELEEGMKKTEREEEDYGVYDIYNEETPMKKLGSPKKMSVEDTEKLRNLITKTRSLGVSPYDKSKAELEIEKLQMKYNQCPTWLESFVKKELQKVYNLIKKYKRNRHVPVNTLLKILDRKLFIENQKTFDLTIPDANKEDDDFELPTLRYLLNVNCFDVIKLIEKFLSELRLPGNYKALGFSNVTYKKVDDDLRGDIVSKILMKVQAEKEKNKKLATEKPEPTTEKPKRTPKKEEPKPKKEEPKKETTIGNIIDRAIGIDNIKKQYDYLKEKKITPEIALEYLNYYEKTSSPTVKSGSNYKRKRKFIKQYANICSDEDIESMRIINNELNTLGSSNERKKAEKINKILKSFVDNGFFNDKDQIIRIDMYGNPYFISTLKRMKKMKCDKELEKLSEILNKYKNNDYKWSSNTIKKLDMKLINKFIDNIKSQEPKEEEQKKLRFGEVEEKTYKLTQEEREFKKKSPELKKQLKELEKCKWRKPDKLVIPCKLKFTIIKNIDELIDYAKLKLNTMTDKDKIEKTKKIIKELEKMKVKKPKEEPPKPTKKPTKKPKKEGKIDLNDMTVSQLKQLMKKYKGKNCPPYSKLKKSNLIKTIKDLKASSNNVDLSNMSVTQLKELMKKYKGKNCPPYSKLRKSELLKTIKDLKAN